MRAVRLDYINGRTAFFGGTQLEVGIDRNIGRPLLLPAEVSGGLFDKRDEGSVQWKIVGQLVKG